MLMKTAPLPSFDVQKGVALLEALIAVLLFSFGVLALVGLQASTMRITTDAKMRVDASYLANQKIGEMWATSIICRRMRQRALTCLNCRRAR